MKKFEIPEITVEKVSVEDIITTSIFEDSGNGDNNTPDQEL